MPESNIIKLPIEPWTAPQAMVFYPLEKCKHRVRRGDFSCAFRVIGRQLLRHAVVHGLSFGKILEVMPYLVQLGVVFVTEDEIEIDVRVRKGITQDRVCRDLARLLEVEHQGFVSLAHFERSEEREGDEWPCRPTELTRSVA